MRIVFIYLMVSAFMMQGSILSAQDNVAFYFAGHPDDWQLFMGHQAWFDVMDPETHVVFVLFTAGDASKGMGSDPGATMPYFKARETGYIHSVKWAAGGKLHTGPDMKSTLPITPYQLDETQLQGSAPHKVKTYHLPGVSTYLFYIPDGMPRGGHPNSMQKLREGKISTLTTIDSSAIYKGWGDLVKTVSYLINQEAADKDQVWIHIPDLDSMRNPYDHSDHRHTALLAREASADQCTHYVNYIDYHTQQLPPNLSREQERIEKFLFSANALAREKAGYGAPWDHHIVWCDRSYLRVERCKP